MHEQIRNIERALLAALERGDTLDAASLRFLLRRSSASEDLIERVGCALAEALPDADRATTAMARATWAALLVEIAQLSDDERVAATLARVMSGLRASWSASSIAEAAAAIEAALCAAVLPEYASAAAEAVDALERLIGAHYHPGRPFGAVADQVQTASALLTAYGLSGRLPYSMLSEELMQSARRSPPADLAAACGAARVLCRLAMLHADPHYRSTAVVAPGAQYRSDAEALLARIAADVGPSAADRGIYGLALLELESCSSLP